MIRRLIITLVAVGLVLTVFFGFQEFKAIMIRRALRNFSNQRQTVSTTIARKQSWQPTLQAIGTLRAQKGTMLSLDVSGIIGNILFKSGQHVQTGQTLLVLRSDDERQKLVALIANADLSRIRYERDRAEFAFHGVSKATLQSAAFSWRNAKALANEETFLIDKRTLRAPFSGQLGIRQVDLGQYLTPGAGIVELQSTDHMLVDFTLPQRVFSRLRINDVINAHIDAFPRRTFTGTILAFNSIVNSNSRNIEVRAELDNQGHLLIPGMFATIIISAGERHSYITVPATAIAYSSYGDTVYLIKHSKSGFIARQRFVVIGRRHGNQVAILSGVYPGQQVITAGQLKLHNGTRVTINNKTTLNTDSFSRSGDE